MAADITRRAKQLTGSQSTLGSLRQRRWWLASFSPGLFCLKKSLVSFVFLSFRVWQHFCFFVMSVSHPCWMRLSAVEGSKWAHVPLLFHLLLPPPTGMAFLFSFSPSFGVCVGPIFFLLGFSWAHEVIFFLTLTEECRREEEERKWASLFSFLEHIFFLFGSSSFFFLTRYLPPPSAARYTASSRDSQRTATDGYLVEKGLARDSSRRHSQ